VHIPIIGPTGTHPGNWRIVGTQLAPKFSARVKQFETPGMGI